MLISADNIGLRLQKDNTADMFIHDTKQVVNIKYKETIKLTIS